MNIKSKLKQIGAAVLLPVLLVSMAACGSKSEPEPEREPDPLYPVTIDGTEILVGQTTVQTLLDKGLSVTVSEMSEDMDITHYEIDPDSELEANSYYTGGSIKVTDNLSFSVSLATDEEVPLGEAVIARLEATLVSETDTGVLEKIAFDGVPVTELTQAKAAEKYPDWTGNEVMWLHYGLEYQYDLNFDMSTGCLNKLALARLYDVDWNG